MLRPEKQQAGLIKLLWANAKKSGEDEQRAHFAHRCMHSSAVKRLCHHSHSLDWDAMHYTCRPCGYQLGLGISNSGRRREGFLKCLSIREEELDFEWGGHSLLMFSSTALSQSRFSQNRSDPATGLRHTSVHAESARARNSCKRDNPSKCDGWGWVRLAPLSPPLMMTSPWGRCSLIEHWKEKQKLLPC